MQLVRDHLAPPAGCPAARQAARAVIDRIAGDEAAFAAMEDGPGQRVHVLFAELYRHITIEWLAAAERHPGLEAVFLLVPHFYPLYRDGVVACHAAPLQAVPPCWRAYHRLARRLTIASPFSTHLWLLSVGARAHVRHDLVGAFAHAADDYRIRTGATLFGQPAGGDIIGPVSDAAFLAGALAFIRSQRSRQRGWRRWLLGLSAVGLKVLRPVWLGVFQSWRQRAFRDAIERPRGASGQAASPIFALANQTDGRPQAGAVAVDAAGGRPENRHRDRDIR